jgi:hypothetical protein
MVSVERCYAFESIESEANYKTIAEDQKSYILPKKNAITRVLRSKGEPLFPFGKVEMRNLTAKYSTSDKPVIKNMNLQV